MKVKLLFLFIIYFVGSEGDLLGQGLEQKIDAFVQPHLENRDFSGVILIAEGEKIIFSKAYGKSNFELNVDAKSNNVFGIGSVSKQFTAAAVMALHEEGLINTEDNICKWVPNLSGCNAVKIHHLLNHTSGLPTNLFDNPDSLMIPRNLRQIANIIENRQLAFTPGEQTQYSNVGYTLLAHIIESESGISFEQYLSTKVLNPVGFVSTYHYENSRFIKNLVQGYDPANNTNKLVPTKYADYSNTIGAGTIFSTVGDLHRWNLALHEGSVLDEQSYQAIINNYGNGRGYGVGLYRRAGQKVIGHDGVYNGFTSFLEWYPDKEVTITYVGNIRSGFLGVLQGGLADIYFQDGEVENYRYEVNYDFHEMNMEKYTGIYELFPGFNLTIDKRSENLRLKGSGGYFTDLIPVKSGHYYYRARFAEIVFDQDDEGKPVLIWIDRRGNEYIARKVN